MKKLIIIIVVFVLVACGLIFFFFPKDSGGGCSYANCQSTECKCFGFKKTWLTIPVTEKCFGLLYSCKIYSINGELIQ